MAQWLTTLVALAEGSSVITSIHRMLTAICPSSSRGPDVLFSSLWVLGTHVVHFHNTLRLDNRI